MKLPRKSILALTILVIGFVLWLPRLQKLSQMRQEIANARAEQFVLAGQLATLDQELSARRQDLNHENDARNIAHAALVSTERTLSAKNPDSWWSQPPANLPEWNTNSPYVWLHKNIIPELRARCFENDGQLLPEVAQVLAVPKPRLEQLNSQLSNLVSEYRAAEVASAQKIDESTPNEKKITIRIDSLEKEGKQLTDGFKTTLLENLGEQRTDYLMNAARSWLDRISSEQGKQSKTITVSKTVDGRTHVVVQHSGWIGQSAVTMAKGNPFTSDMNPIPQHLMPFFNEFLDDEPKQVMFVQPQ